MVQNTKYVVQNTIWCGLSKIFGPTTTFLKNEFWIARHFKCIGAIFICMYLIQIFFWNVLALCYKFHFPNFVNDERYPLEVICRILCIQNKSCHCFRCHLLLIRNSNCRIVSAKHSIISCIQQTKLIKQTKFMYWLEAWNSDHLCDISLMPKFILLGLFSIDKRWQFFWDHMCFDAHSLEPQFLHYNCCQSDG